MGATTEKTVAIRKETKASTANKKQIKYSKYLQLYLLNPISNNVPMSPKEDIPINAA
jgi:hypothetical protein